MSENLMKTKTWASPDAIALEDYLIRTESAVIDALKARAPKAFDLMKDHRLEEFALRSAYKEGFQAAIIALMELSKLQEPLSNSADAGTFTNM
jgi:hypothetical protein